MLVPNSSINGGHGRGHLGSQYLGEGCLTEAAIARDTDCYRVSRKTSHRVRDFVERGLPPRQLLVMYAKKRQSRQRLCLLREVLRD